MNTQRPIPLRPDPEAVRPHVAARFVSRAAYAVARHALNPYRDASVEEIARGLWATDMVTPLVLRAASSPATTTTSTWAGSLASSAVGDFISSLVPFSAAARLFNVAPRVSLDGVNSITFPRRSGPIDPAAVPWIAQGAPIPVTQLILTSVQVGPACKLCIAVSMTRETAEHGSGEAVLTTLLRENAALALDASLFSNAAATADRPAGLLNGISALTAAPNGDDAAMAADLSALANAISDDGVGLAFVAHPGQAHTMRLRRGTTFPADIPIWSTLGVAEGVVIALDPQAVVSAFGAEPEVSASKEALIHQETSPAQIGVAGSPNVVAAPTRSLFQTDCVAIRLILRAAWALRAPGAIAHAR